MKKLLSVTLLSGLLTLLRMVCGFFIAKVVAIHTGPSGIAMLGQVQSLIGVLNGIVASPAGSGMVRYTAENQAQGYEACSPWWRACVYWLMALLVITLPLVCLTAKPLAKWLFDIEDYAWLVVVAALALPLSALNTLLASVINGQQQYKRYMGLGAISIVISTTLMVVLILSLQLTGALFAGAIFSAMSGLVMLLGSIRQPWFRLHYWLGSVCRKQLAEIGGYVVMAITSAFCFQASLILVRNILVDNLDWQQAGYWQAVYKISEVYVGVITMALATYYLPKLSSLTGIESIRREIASVSKLVMPIAFILAISVYFLRDIAIAVLFTEQFRPARDLFALQLLGDVVKVMSWLYSYPMLSRGATRWFVATEVIFSFGFVAFTWILVPLYGVQGANVAYTINYLLYLIFVFVFFKRFAK